jgi:hypothetical protein
LEYLPFGDAVAEWEQPSDDRRLAIYEQGSRVMDLFHKTEGVEVEFMYQATPTTLIKSKASDAVKV